MRPGKRPEKLRNILQVTAQAVREGRLTYSGHANSRMKERDITKPDVERLLTLGQHEARKDQFHQGFDSWDYAIKGQTIDGRSLRVVIALVHPGVCVVTAIDLDAKED